MEFTPSEKRVLGVLSDGFPHTKDELLPCLDYSRTHNALGQKMFHLKKKLQKRGETILCEYYFQKYMYRHVRLLCKSE